MNQNTILPEDPRLTLYALNEMAPAERAEFEKLLQQDAAARQTVEEIRALAATVTSALENEPAMVGSEEGKPISQAAIVPGQFPGKLDGGSLKKPGKLIRFPQVYFMISGLAAACFAVFFAYWQQNRPNHVPHQYMEVDVTKVASAEAEKKVKQEETGDAAKAMEDVAARNRLTQAGAAPLIQLDLPSMPQPVPLAPAAGAIVDSMVLKSSVVAKEASAAGRALGGARQRSELKDVGAVAHLSKALEMDFNNEAYAFRKDNDYQRVVDHPLSTFSVDVDTASYANVRRFLTQGQRPPADAVRIEELVNYFPYRYAPPTGNVPFAAHLEVASAPWASEHRLVRIGLKGREVSDAQRPAANLVFLLDVSGSMNEPNKLPLVKQSLRLLVNKLRSDDHVAIAVYAGASGLALPSTPANRKAEILEAIDRLQAEGSTNGAMGIQLAYDIVKANFVPGGVNRVILATDGDWNVGTTNEGELLRLIGEKAKSGVFLTVLGFGMGNLKDSMLEQLADKGNGNYAYIDTLAEAKKSLVEQAGGTLVTIAKDVKIQVEFNPAQVQAYRLIGYENRLLAKEDFNDDKVDAGEIGAGHTVTALYEVVPAGTESPVQAPGVDALKYLKPVSGVGSKEPGAMTGELLTVKIRYKEPTGEVSSKLEFPLRDTGARFEEASADFKFAAAVAAFGMELRGSPHKGSLTLAAVADWGRAGLVDDAGGYRNEFLGLVKQAEALPQ